MKQTQYSIGIKFIVVTLFVSMSCTDFVQIDPPKNELSSATIFNTEAVAESAVRGLYSNIASKGLINGGPTSTTLLGDLLSDQLTTTSALFIEFNDNNIESRSATIGNNWNDTYNTIYQANALLEGLTKSTALSSEARNTFTGEALFLRSFCYFYLTNLWGDVPLVLSTDYSINSSINRSSQQAVHDQIIQDLLVARELLPADYKLTPGERTRANKWSAGALLAKVYLHTGQWAEAETEATRIIEAGNSFVLESPNGVFLKQSKEVILQLYPTINLSGNTREGQTFLPITSSRAPFYWLQQNLISAFEAGDYRFSNWTKTTSVNGTVYVYPYKYKIRNGATSYMEYSVILRLAEQYLIRSEARAQQDKLFGQNSAEADINAIRNRAGLTNATATNKADMLTAILHERRLEFFAENGHRWFDLIRTGLANEILSGKPGWQETDIRWPIPQREIDMNLNLRQNEGY